MMDTDALEYLGFLVNIKFIASCSSSIGVSRSPGGFGFSITAQEAIIRPAVIQSIFGWELPLTMREIVFRKAVVQPALETAPYYTLKNYHAAKIIPNPS